MDLILVRHGMAEDLGGDVRRDADRRLTDEGRQRTRQAAAGLLTAACSPDVILSSPYVRARETADLLDQVLRSSGGVENMDKLAAGADSTAVIDAVARRTEGAVMLVGHMPDLSDIASVLLIGGTGVSIEFKKAAACCLACEPRPMPDAAWLRWMLPPRILRRLGGLAED